VYKRQNIYCGAFEDKEVDLINDFVSTIGKSEWWGITTNYFAQQTKESPRAYVSDVVTMGQTLRLPDFEKFAIAEMEHLITKQIEENKLPLDENHIYNIMTSSKVELINIEGFEYEKDFCAFHTFYTHPASQKVLKFSFVPESSPSSKCVSKLIRERLFRSDRSPNGMVAIDGMINHLAHELTETATNPYVKSPKAWIDQHGQENADKCGWKFGDVQYEGKAAYNYVSSSGKRFLVQQNWDWVSKQCLSGIAHQ
jgi:hypothetical protein